MANNLQKGSAGPMRLYVGSLHFNITEDMLRGIFEPFGRVRSDPTLWWWCGLSEHSDGSGKTSASQPPNICIFSLLCTYILYHKALGIELAFQNK